MQPQIDRDDAGCIVHVRDLTGQHPLSLTVPADLPSQPSAHPHPTWTNPVLFERQTAHWTAWHQVITSLPGAMCAWHGRPALHLEPLTTQLH
jgi:hypothetical protein